MKKHITLLVILCFCLVLQGTLFEYLAVGPIKPDLAILFVIYIALHHKPAPAAIYGFVVGLIFDVYLGKYIGLYAIILAVIALVIGFIQQRWYRENLIVTMVLVFFLTFIGLFLIKLIAITSGLGWFSRNPLDIITGISLYNSLLVPLTYPLIHRSFTKGLLRSKYEQQE